MKNKKPGFFAYTTLLVIILAAVGRAENITGVIPTLHWPLDDTGSGKTIDDGPQHLDGVISGSVVAGLSGVHGKAFGGFTTPTSNVSYSWASSGIGNLWMKDFTLTMWIKNPGAEGVNLIARGGQSPEQGFVGDQGWQLFAGQPDSEGKRKFYFSTTDWNSKSETQETNPVAMLRDAWYQIAVVYHYLNGGQEKYQRRVELYLSLQGNNAVTKILSGTTKLHTGGPPPVKNGDNSLIIGGARPASWGPTQKAFPGGYWGGQIDDASLWLGTGLTESDLDRLLQ